MEENGKNEPIFVDTAVFLVEVSFTLGFLVRVILARPETVFYFLFFNSHLYSIVANHMLELYTGIFIYISILVIPYFCIYI
jgi:hypothetical protein